MNLTRAWPFLLLGVSTAGFVTHWAIASTVSPTVLPVKAETLNKQMQDKAQSKDDRNPGGLFAQSRDGKPLVFPLKNTDVKAKIDGNLSRVEVTQTFENPLTDPLEAVYVFPLPDSAAVDDMEIQIGDRIIKGDIKKREEAQQIYEQARREGRTAGLLEQERDNIFTQSLANIKPGEQIQVTIRYSESLKFEGGDYEFVFPMVVGPRYIPGNPLPNNPRDTDQVPDASRITPPILKPGTRSGHDINVQVEINAGIPITEVRSTSHQIVTQREGDRLKVALEKGDNIPNKDLILRYRVSGKTTETTVLSQADEKGGHFAVYLIPALDYAPREIVPKDVVFLMDTSGSQSGDPIVKSQELMRRFINGLNPNDTFTIIDFSETTRQLSSRPLANTPENRAKAIAYINQLDANGGTELLNGIRAVLNFPASESNRLRSVVLVTDGYIGNDPEVIAEVRRQLKPGNRLYSFGVGSSVNRFLLERLAEVGRGTSQVIRQDEPSQPVAEKFFRQINNPVLTNIQVVWEGTGPAPEIYPAAAPDLFSSQPLVIFGKKGDRTSGRLRITGVAAGGQRYEKIIPVNFENGGNPAIAQLWGRAKIKDLMNQMYGQETTSGVQAVTNTALAYRLLSQYTAFVAVSQEVRVNPDGTQQRVDVPVELPQGVSYEGIFTGQDRLSSRLQGNVILSAPAPTAMPRSLVAPPGGVNQRAGGATRGRFEEAESAPTLPNQNQVPVGDLSMTPTPAPAITVLEAPGLDASAIANLTQLLQGVSVAKGMQGEIQLEVVTRGGRVVRVLLDDQKSTLQDAQLVKALEQALLRWQVPASAPASIRLKLQVRG